MLKRTSRVQKVRLLIAFALIIVSLPLSRSQAAAGDLDPIFGNGGIVITSFPGNAGASEVVIQPDGKIVAAGRSSVGFALARYLANGQLDPSFGTGGKVTTQFPGLLIGADALALQSDGKIVAAGLAANTFTGGLDFALARYNTDGSLDTSFGNGGVVITDFFGGFAGVAALAIQADGKIVAAGQTSRINDGTTQDFAIARYNPDGSLDTTFGVGGKVTTDFFGLGDVARAIGIQPNGNIVVAGAAVFDSQHATIALAQYLPSGALDPSFGNGGKVTTLFGDSNEAVALALQPDGKIVVAGFDNSGINLNFAVVRYTSSGLLDSMFGNGGLATVDFFGGFAAAEAVALRPDGKIVVGGTDFNGAAFEFGLAQLTASGSLDTTFGAGGKVTTSISQNQDIIRDLAIQPDGKIVVAGISVQPGSEFFALARYGDSQVIFDFCLQQDGNGNLLQFNSATGDYLFTNCSGVSISGTGSVVRKGGVITLQHNAADRRVLARFITNANKATATVQLLSAGTTYTISDRDTTNNTCTCE